MIGKLHLLVAAIPTIRKTARYSFRSGAICLASFLPACGAAGEDPSPPVKEKVSVNVRARLESLKLEVDRLDQQSRNLRDALDQIDASRKTLSVQVARLTDDLLASAPESSPSLPETVPPALEAAGTEPESDRQVAGIIIRIIALLVIIPAVFLLVKTFFSRWGEEETIPVKPPAESEQAPEAAAVSAQPSPEIEDPPAPPPGEPPEV